MRKISVQQLVYPTFLSLGLLGFLFSSVGVTLPVLRTTYSLTVDEAGMVSGLVQFGYAVFCFISGVLSDVLGKKRVLTAGCILYGLSGLFMGAARSFHGNLLFFIGLGVGSGLIFTSSNSLVVALYPEQRDRYLNLHHLVFAIASFASPLVSSRLLLSGAHWSTVYHGLGTVSVTIGVLFLAILLLGDRLVEGGGGGVRMRGVFAKYAAMFGNKPFLVLLATGALSVGAQFAIIYLLVMFLSQGRGVPLGTASAILAVYFVFLSLGRYICSRLVRTMSVLRIITFLLLALIATLFAGWLTSGALSLALFSLTGLACSGLMPNMLSLATRILPEEVRGSALGVFSMCGGLGGMTVTYGTTLVAAHIGLDKGFLTIAVVSVAAAALFRVFLRMDTGMRG